MIRNIGASFVTSLLLLTPNISVGETVILNCDIGGMQTQFGLDIENTSVELLSLDEPVHGELTTEDRKYTLHFPKSVSRWETIVKIDRYNGVLEWEHGDPPFGVLSFSNVMRSGTCKLGAADPLF